MTYTEGHSRNDLNILLSILLPILVPARKTDGCRCSTRSRNSFSVMEVTSSTKIPPEEKISTAGPVTTHSTVLPRALSGRTTGTIQVAPPGSLALTSILLGEFMLMGKHFS